MLNLISIAFLWKVVAVVAAVVLLLFMVFFGIALVTNIKNTIAMARMQKRTLKRYEKRFANMIDRKAGKHNGK